MIQMLLSVDLMHRKGIVHRDLKPDNVLLLEEDSFTVCLSDLGMACRTTDIAKLRQRCGTPGFVAPEILKGQSAGTKADVFSLGSLMYSLLTNRLLFSAPDVKQML
jgi:serine/threonine protein kinase